MNGCDNPKPLSLAEAERLKADSERLFATTFINWFGNKIPLYHEPKSISVVGLGTTVPDFMTPFGNGHMYYEVTLTNNTFNANRKQTQWKILNCWRKLHPEDFHLEINGNALRCADTTMQALEDMYNNFMSVVSVQKLINSLGRDANFFASVIARELI